MSTTDQYAELRAALDAGPTPGPWVCDWPPDSKTSEGEYADVSVWAGKAFDGQFINNIAFDNTIANGNYIAAANPEAIRALLAERDALREALARAVDLAKRTHAHWDADRDMQVGKLLLALSGYLPGYDNSADVMHATLTQQEQGK